MGVGIILPLWRSVGVDIMRCYDDARRLSSTDGGGGQMWWPRWPRRGGACSLTSLPRLPSVQKTRKTQHFHISFNTPNNMIVIYWMVEPFRVKCMKMKNYFGNPLN